MSTVVYIIETIASTMSKIIKPETYNASPAAPNAAKLWYHRLTTLGTFSSLFRMTIPINLRVLTNHVFADIYTLISETENYNAALAILKATYARTSDVL